MPASQRTTGAPARRAGLRAELLAAHPDVDAILITDLVNVRYLSGFTGSNGAVLVWADPGNGDLISTDGRYTVQVGEQAGDVRLVSGRDVAAALLNEAHNGGARRIAIEAIRKACPALCHLAGEIGDLLLMRAYRMQGPVGSAFTLPRDPKVDPSELQWQIQRFHSFLWASGGGFSDFNIHNIDEACWMKNDWPVEV